MSGQFASPLRLWVNDARHYFRQLSLIKQTPASLKDWARRWREFSLWRRTIRQKVSPLALKAPWITFPARDFIESHIPLQPNIFEYGAGGSTLFFASFGGKVISVEHDRQWYSMVREACQRAAGDAIEVHFAEPEAGNAAGDSFYLSSSPEYRNMSFRNYASMIDRYGDGQFDLVVVDGRARVACAAHAEAKVKPGGFLLLDDGHRETYRPAVERLIEAGWKCRRFPGMGPVNWEAWETYIFEKSA